METVLRIALIYVVILAGLRIVGKREFAQLSPLELVSLLMIPEIVSQSLVREDYSIVNALIGLTTLLCLVYLTSVLQQRFKKVSDWISGEAAVLVHHGKFQERAMNESRVSPEEIYSELRMAGLETLDQAKWVILEPDGKISIVPEEPGGLPNPRSEKDRPI
jgi:uncharacterized membrane protein YcaP (DUF421 family)